MKIAIDISQAVYGVGVSRYTEELVKNLLKVDSKNQYILFGASLRQMFRLRRLKDELSKYPNVSFKLIPIPIRILEFLWNRLHVLKIETFVGNIDLLHSSDWVEPPANQKTKKVTTIHDLLVYLFPSSLHPRIVANQKARLSWVQKETDILIANSKTTAEDLVKFLQVPPEKVKVTYLAPAPIFKPQDQEKVDAVLKKYKIKKPYILSVSTQEPRKNIHRVIDVFEKLNKEHPEIKLVLTGKKGWGKEASAQNENVIFTGFVPEKDLTCLYSGCRVFVYPSLYEGFGFPILEAMSCGAPVVCSNNSSMIEIAKDAAILVDPRSESQITKALEMVLELGTEDYQKMVNASLDRARQYSWAKTAKQTLQIYRQLVEDLNKTKEEPKEDDEKEITSDHAGEIKQLS